MRSSPLYIEEYYIKESAIRVHSHSSKLTSEQAEGLNEEGDLEVTIQIIPHKKDPERYQVSMKLELKSQEEPEDHIRPPYDILVSIYGNFRISDAINISKTNIEKILGMEVVSILYGAARDHIASVTSRCQPGAFYLPAVKFAPLKVVNLAGKPTQKAQKKKRVSKASAKKAAPQITAG